MGKQHKYFLGMCDDNGDGRKNCEAYITWELKDGKFSMCAETWLPSKRDIIRGGQCVDYVAAMFPHDKKAQRMAEIWKRWHLNDLTAGSPAQELWLRENPIAPEDYRFPKSYYAVARERLAAVGLNPDPNFIYKGKPYSYGHAWLKEELPAEIVAEIQSW